MPIHLNRNFRVHAFAVALLVLPGCGSNDVGTPVVESDPRPDADLDPRRVLARIQSNMERVAARRPRHVLAEGKRNDALERVVDGYAAFLAGNTREMDAALADVARTAQSRRAMPNNDSKYDLALAADRDQYFELIDKAAASPAPLVRLLAGLRNADSVLFIEASKRPFMSLEERHMAARGPAQTSPDPLNDTWLRLPCRTLRGRLTQFAVAAKEAQPLNGPMLSCPSDTNDFAELERRLDSPQRFAPHVVPPMQQTEPKPPENIPPPPWDADSAVRFMAQNPDAAEAALKAAATSAVGKLDYALFLHAFRTQTPARDAQITGLLKQIAEAPADGDVGDAAELSGEADKPYDGSDASLVPKIVVASESGAANTESAFYAIPCDVLLARPKLLAATQARYYSNRDNFIPRSGCSWGRGKVRGFPDLELSQWIAAAAEADGYFVDTFEGTMKYGFETSQAQASDTLRLDPRGLLEQPDPPLDYPYQTWGLLSLGNRDVAAALKARYEVLQAKISSIYEKRGLTPDESRRAAKTGLFAAVFGADCGGGVPKSSPRATLLSGEVPANLAELAPDDAAHDAPETEACAVFADMDPLLHVAVASPKALAALLDRTPTADLRDPIGKTPLMVAAQHDFVDSARLLLAHKAEVNTTTFVKTDGYTSDGLAHDARSPLMYAAASGSLTMIRLLLDAGADPYQADSKGARAIDYLLGYGPVGANRRLTAEERQQAAIWLF
jgi:hypothetical protein